MKDKFQSKAVPKGTRTIWRYLSALILLFTFAIGNVWADQTDLISDVTLPDVPASSLDMSSQTTFTPDANGWIVMQPNADVRNKDYTWFTAMAWNTSSQSISDVSSFTAPFYTLSSVAVTTVQKTGRTKAIRFTGATDVSFLVHSGGSRTIYVSLYTLNTLTSAQSLVETKSQGNAWGELLFSGLSNANTYVAYMYESTNSNGYVAEIAIKKYVASGPVDPTITFYDGEYTLGGSALDLSSLFSSNSKGAVTYSVTNANGTGAVIGGDGKSFTATTAGTATVQASQVAEDGKYNAKVVTATIAVAECETSISSQPANASLKVGDANPTLSITASNVSAYAWKESSDGTSYDGSSTLATTASFTPSVNDAEQTKYYYCEVTSDCDGKTVVKSDVATIEVEASPIIIKVELSGDIASATKVVSGSIGGTSEFAGLQNSTAPYKIGSNTAYLNVTLATGYFQPGDSVVLNLSKAGQIFYGATDNSETYLLGTTTSKSGIHYFVLPSTFPANTNSIHVGRTSSTYNGTLSYLAVYRIPTCPTNLTISGEKAYVPGDKIELTASLAKGNGEISYQWYKGSVAVGNEVSGATSAKLEIASCSASDAGDYFCVASKDGCSDAVNAEAYTITVNAFVPVSSITISPASPIVMEKRTITLTAEVLPAEATEKVVTWSIKAGSETYASVNATTGEVTGIAEGNAVIVASATDGSSITAEKTVVVTPFVCPTKGEIASVVYDLAKKPGSEQTIPGNSRINMTTYATVTNAVAYLGNTGGSGNAKVTTSTFKLGGSQAYAKLELDCALKEGDTIRLDNSTTIKLSLDTAKTAAITVSLASGKHDYIVPAEGDNLSTIFVWQNGSNVEFSYIKVIRPAKYDVTFNMHGHGTQVEPQNILEGGKVTEPATTDITDWDFGGWFKESTFDNEWDFDNDVVNAAIELHAKWTEHTTSNDATLSDLKVDGVTVAGFEPATVVYNVVLDMGTSVVPTVAGTANDSHAKSVVVTDATSLPGATTVVVTAEDNTTKTYTINFSVATSKNIVLVYKTNESTCAGDASAVAKASAFATYLDLVEGTESNNSSVNTTATTGAKITIAAKPGYAFKAMSFYGKVEDGSCEVSLDGADATTLALDPENNGDACYDVFSNAEVHSFSIINTGTHGVWIRNMQLTIIEACTPIVITWDAEPVEFEVGKAGQAIAATANNGGTITYGSTDASIVAVDAGNGVLSVAALGSVSLSASTAEGDGTTYCDNSGTDIVISKAVNTYYLVKFDGQNGEAADEVKFYAGDVEVALPASDPLFAGHTFAGWFDAATGGNAVTAAFTPAASMTLYAHWTTDCTAPTIVEHPESANYFTGRTADALECQATAAGGNALTYKWYSCDDDQKTNPQELSGAPTPSTAVAGTFYFFCAVTEEGCANVAYSNVAVITVSDKDPICLAWVDVTANNTVVVDALKSLYAPEVSASNVKNTSSYGGKTGYKFNSDPAYIAIEGAPFKAGDIVEMFVTNTTADVMRVYKANTANDANQIGVGTANVALGVNKVALSEDANNLYLRRGDDHSGWNPSVAYVAVYRACAPILNKVTVAGVDGTPDNTNHVAIEVPFSTTDAALSSVAIDWISNNAAWDAAHDPAVANAWEFGVENTVTLTDKDGESSVYYVTISKAVASTNVELATLTVNGNAVDIVPGQDVYNYELPYGSAAPTVAATAEDSYATVGTITQAASATGSATFTVTAEDGSTHRDYTINFSISKWKEVVIWDGSYMDAVATSPDAVTGFAWAVNGFGSISNYNTTCGEKSYTKVLPSSGSSTGRYMTLTVPEGYVAKFYVVMASHSDDSERGMFIGSNLVKNPDATSVLELSNNDRDIAVAGMSEIVGAGTWYINPNASIDFQEIRAYLRPGYARTAMLGNGVLGTICVDHNVAIADVQGASIYELVGKVEATGKIAFDEIVSGEMVAGVPYVFQAHGDKLVLFYGDTKVVEPVDLHNGMYGTFEQLVLTGSELEGVYYFAERALWSCAGANSLTVAANRAYVKLGELPDAPSANPAPGRRRITFGVNGEQVATDIDNLNASEKPVKLMIDGQLFIIRGEKMFDATGRLVK
ncbi:MAG: InlB B-repeat-containing protein [Paludibacteraceae bacterium]|nr:InlB B-repeat-containing protein [Paludibacteraceae bacterium]